MKTRSGWSFVAFILLVNVILLAAGNFMDPAAIVLIMTPILFPVTAALAVQPVHLGISMAVNMEVGLCNPLAEPLCGVGHAKMGIGELTIAVLPWLLTMFGFLLLVTFVPDISLWLPRQLGLLY